MGRTIVGMDKIDIGDREAVALLQSELTNGGCVLVQGGEVEEQHVDAQVDTGHTIGVGDDTVVIGGTRCSISSDGGKNIRRAIRMRLLWLAEILHLWCALIARSL